MTGRKLILEPLAESPPDENSAQVENNRGPRLCDLSADELRKLWQRPSAEDMKNAMETIARLAFQLRGRDIERQRRLLKALKTLQEIQNLDEVDG